jgi:perosamine synthetase
MVASVTAAVVYGATPVFADIDPNTFCLTPESVYKCVTPKTKAVIVVDLFGHPVDIPAIRDAAGVPVIEDAAQAPGAARNSNYCGTQADIGVLSLNYHKTIHCGEGGVAMTNNDELTERLQLIRNHGEAVVADFGYHHDIVGFNYRLTEIEAAIAYEQLKKLDRLVTLRGIRASCLYGGLSDMDILGLPEVPKNSVHGYYVFPIKALPPVARNWFVKAMQCEGIPVNAGYTKPIYLEPLYAKYKCWCPVVENIEFTKMMTTMVHYSGEVEDMDDVIEAFHKVGRFVERCSSP